MTDQMSIFGPSPQELRDAALEAVARGADPLWKHHAADALAHCAAALYEFSSDDVWHRLEAMGVPLPREPRALGAVMMAAVKSGMLVRTGRYVNSELGRNHARPVAVYRGAWR